MQFDDHRRKSRTFDAALIARCGRNGGNPDFPIAELKRDVLVRRFAQLARVACLVVRYASHELHVTLIPLSPNNVLGDNLAGARVNAIYEFFLRLIPGFIDMGQTGARKSHGEFRVGARPPVQSVDPDQTKITTTWPGWSRVRH